MPSLNKTSPAAPAKTLEVKLWDAANKMRGAVPPTEYMHVCLGMVFLRYLSAAFEWKHANPVCLWFFAKNKSRRRQTRLPRPPHENHLHRCPQLGTLIDRELTDVELVKITNTCHLWRHQIVRQPVCAAS